MRTNSWIQQHPNSIQLFQLIIQKFRISKRIAKNAISLLQTKSWRRRNLKIKPKKRSKFYQLKNKNGKAFVNNGRAKNLKLSVSNLILDSQARILTLSTAKIIKLARLMIN
jgi:hypothetical protein